MAKLEVHGALPGREELSRIDIEADRFEHGLELEFEPTLTAVFDDTGDHVSVELSIELSERRVNRIAAASTAFEAFQKALTQARVALQLPEGAPDVLPQKNDGAASPSVIRALSILVRYFEDRLTSMGEEQRATLDVEIEDLVEETIARACEQPGPEAAALGGPQSWLIGLARDTLRRHLLRRSQTETIDLEPPPEVLEPEFWDDIEGVGDLFARAVDLESTDQGITDPGSEREPPQERAAEQDELRERLQTHLNALPENERRALELRFFDEMSPKAIAALLHLHRRQVDRELRSALHHLRERMGSELS